MMTMNTQSVHSPYVIAIANQKGGVAKTTTVVSLGGALVNHQKQVLMVDLDAQANLTLALGKDPSRVRGVISQVFFNAASLTSVIRETGIEGLDLIASNTDMDTAERFLPLRKNHEKILLQAIRGNIEPQTMKTNDYDRVENEHSDIINGNLDNLDIIDQNNNSSATHERPSQLKHTWEMPYDYIIMDCPPIIGAVTLNAIIAADMLLIPTQPEFFSAHALRTMMLTIKQVRKQYNPNLVYRILITMFDRRNRIHRQVKEQIHQTFGSGVLTTMIEIDTKLRESAVEGIPVTHHPAASRAHPPRSALQYEALAQELIEYVSTQ